MNQHLSRRQLIGGALASGLALRTASAATAPVTLFREVTLVDGTGTPPRLADVFVTGDRIAGITAPDPRMNQPMPRLSQPAGWRDIPIDAETALRYGAFREHGVVMTDDQHLRIVAALPVHMRTFVARNNLWGLAK